MLSNEKEMVIQQVSTRNRHDKILKIFTLLFLSVNLIVFFIIELVADMLHIDLILH